jgi:AraC-like DNA-binding protein
MPACPAASTPGPAEPVPIPGPSILPITFLCGRCTLAYDLMGVFEQVQALLEDNPRIPMAKLSRELNVDRHTIGKAVQLAAGMPFRTWKRGLLFHQACQLLAGTPDRRIQAISSGLGYSSLASFRRFVGRNCHLSPTALPRHPAQWPTSHCRRAESTFCGLYFTPGEHDARSAGAVGPDAPGARGQSRHGPPHTWKCGSGDRRDIVGQAATRPGSNRNTRADRLQREPVH